MAKGNIPVFQSGDGEGVQSRSDTVMLVRAEPAT